LGQGRLSSELYFLLGINYNFYMNNENNDENNKYPPKKPNKFFKFIRTLLVIIIVLAIGWTAFSLIGRVNAASVIPDSASLRICISNPMRLLDGILNHESLDKISDVPAFSQVASILINLKDNIILKNSLLRLAARGNLELALLPSNSESETLIAVWDFGFFSPLLRILPAITNFANIPDLYYVQAGKNSRFEYRLTDRTLYVGTYRNMLFVTDNARIFESRSAANSGHAKAFSTIKPSDYDAALMLSNEFVSSVLSGQDAAIAAILNNIEFDSRVEAGLSIYPKKIEFHIAAPLSSGQANLSRILGQRSRVPGMAERVPSNAQYATILSAGTLEELYQTALVFTPDLDSALKTADNASKMILGLTLNDLLFSWSGNEFAAFGLEGRPHPVYAIQIADEKKRQSIFDKAFKSAALNENLRLNLDGVRIPRIEIPEFLQSLLRRWDIFIPSPYYTVYKDYFLVSESAEALLAALRAMQRNDVLPKTATWRNIAGGKTVSSSFSLYYSLDLSVPFFLRNNTAFSGFLSVYRQGLARMSFNKGLVEVTLSLVPGSGSGITLVSGYPLDAGARPSNRIYGAGKGDESRIFYSSGNTAFSLKIADNSVSELSGQGNHWVIPADGVTVKDAQGTIFAWVVTDRGRVTLVDSNMEAVQGFPLLTGLQLSSAPVAFMGKLYLCDEDGKVYSVDANGKQNVWETSFTAALRSPPSFLSVSGKKENIIYTAAYPKSFFGEIWFLDDDGKTLPNWPAPIAVEKDDDGETGGSLGIGFGSPLLFARNNKVYIAFVNQSGQLLVYYEDAALVPPFPVLLDGIFFQQPVFDGEYLWLVSSDGTFFRVSLEGEVLYQNIPGFSAKEEGHITFFDSDGDKAPEIYITGDGNALYAYTRNFRSLEGFPLPAWGKPFFIPAQGSKKAEIFGMGMDRRLYRWQFK
jgi:outer membrane protein assembly factor BamB